MNSTERFSDRVENYRRYRPGYPAQVINLVHNIGGLESSADVADIGSGTGILSRLLLEADWTVHAVEPNTAMRQAAESDLGSFSRFRSLASTAEATGLPEGSIAAITCAQAFHWFNREAARAEFRRILRPGGWTFLLWNERDTASAGGFDQDYHAILASLGQEYEGIKANRTNQELETFFLSGTYATKAFPNPQFMTWEVLRGRFLSSSYVPAEDDSRHVPLLRDLETVFQRYQQDGKVIFQQNTHVYFGQLEKA